MTRRRKPYLVHHVQKHLKIQILEFPQDIIAGRDVCGHVLNYSSTHMSDRLKIGNSCGFLLNLEKEPEPQTRLTLSRAFLRGSRPPCFMKEIQKVNHLVWVPPPQAKKARLPSGPPSRAPSLVRRPARMVRCRRSGWRCARSREKKQNGGHVATRFWGRLAVFAGLITFYMVIWLVSWLFA